MKKRMMSLLLVCALLFSMVPAFAAETNTGSGTVFNDVRSDEWFAGYVLSASKYGLMNGTGNNMFEPGGTSTRAQFVQALYNMAGRPEVAYDSRFADVPDGQWYSRAVSWAVANGITNGTDATHFSPDERVTRQQVAVFLYAYEGKPSVTGSLSSYPDEADVADWSYNALIWATQNRIMIGSDENGVLKLIPDSSAIRAQVAAMLVAYFNYKEGLCTEGQYSINSVEAEENSGALNVTAALNTVKSGILTVELLADDMETVIDTKSVNTTREMSGDTRTVSFDSAEVPEYFYLRTTLTDFDGNQTCDSSICMQYSSAHADFMNQTADDYDEEDVLNFDEDTEDNFAVVYDDVQLLSDGADGNSITAMDDLTFTVSGPAFVTMQEGDRFVLSDSDGTAHMVTVESMIDRGNGTYTITSEDKGSITEFFTYFQYSSSTEDSVVDQDEVTSMGRVNLGTVSVSPSFSAGAFSVKAKASLNPEIDCTLEWCTGLFSDEKAYLYFQVENQVAYEFTATLKAKGELKNAKGEDYEIPIKQCKVNFANGLIELNEDFGVPLEFSASASAEIQASGTLCTGYTLDSQNSDRFYCTVRDKKATMPYAEGEIEGKISLRLLSENEVGDDIYANLMAQAGIDIDGELKTRSDTTEGVNKIHGCSLCFQGEVSPFAEGKAEAEYELRNPFTGNVIDVFGHKLEGSLEDSFETNFDPFFQFHVSIKNDGDSLYGGALNFGLCACENDKYRTELKALDETGSLYSTTVDAAGSNTSGYAASESAASGEYVYLYPGAYTASATIDEEDCTKEFTKSSTVSTVLVQPKTAALYVRVVDEDGNPIDADIKVTSTDVAECKGAAVYNGVSCTRYKVTKGDVSVEASADKYSTESQVIGVNGPTLVTLTLKDLSWLEAYAEVIRNSHTSLCFTLCYVDGDDIPELVISYGQNMHIATSELYTYYDDQAVNLGSCADYGAFYYLPGQNRVICSNWANGYGSTISPSHISEGRLVKDITLKAYYKNSNYNTTYYSADGSSITRSRYESLLEAYGVNDKVSADFSAKCTSANADRLLQDYTQFLDQNR